MGRTNYFHSLFVVALLAALALYGMVVVEFIFTVVTTILVAAGLFYGVLFFMYVVDRIIDYFYEMR